MMADGSKSASFMDIAMPDPQYDSLAMGLVQNYEPLAGSLMYEWSKQDRKGILIDLRGQTEGQNGRADFRIEKVLPGDIRITIPVVFLWDDQSLYRAYYFMHALQSLQAIKCSLINNSRETGRKGRQDCFSPTAPGFDGQ
jgi:hypothetical protein